MFHTLGSKDMVWAYGEKYTPNLKSWEGLMGYLAFERPGLYVVGISKQYEGHVLFLLFTGNGDKIFYHSGPSRLYPKSVVCEDAAPYINEFYQPSSLYAAKIGRRQIQKWLENKSICGTVSTLNQVLVKRIQGQLRNCGYDPGPIDGVYGDRTADAVTSLQRQKGLEVTGVLNQPTLDTLKQSSAQVISIGDFFNNLCHDFPAYKELRVNEYTQFSQKYDLNSESIDSQNQYFKIYFLHDLFTGFSAQNYVSGGILKIPYFWHWVEPNPRHKIVFYGGSINLNKIKPPAEFDIYKSYADIDRTPSLYLDDLLTDSPKYYHEQCSEFYTFGWCSEREMAFNTLLEIMGFQSKIKQTGIHTWSEILLNFKGKDNGIKRIVFKVDNTFDTFEYELIDEAISIKEWREDIGQGSTIKWYNNKAHSPYEINKVKNIKVNEKASSRIKKLVEVWLQNNK